MVRTWFVLLGMRVPCQLVPKGSAGILSHPVLVLGSAACLAASSSSAQPIRARPGESDIWQEKGNLGRAWKSEAVLLQAGPWVHWHDMKDGVGACWSSVSSGSPGSCWLPTALVIPATVAAEGSRAKDVSRISKFFHP